MEEPESIFHPVQAIAWGGTLICSAIITVIYFYSTFETQIEATRQEERVVKRLESIEQKVDRLIEQR